ncbi:bifunctional DNA-formamidopyrimidine glycosylase/DNA-(apurinic or apyrimidinic site) lyase [Sporosarcina sp. OR05]|uniref:bifunctional DNA-formamidopyrimidine glycosylase/DNA-(apurinic or apyrimidinic site) lyase n=1 Tax=Sporosarcina sp. OR05 TaxID=2969819 RepID=UPI00352B1D0F
MPELPEVEGVVRELAPASSGRTIVEVEVSSVIKQSKELGKEAIVKGKTLDDFITELPAMTIKNVTRRSKYIYFHLEKEGQSHLLVSHLGMTGAWFVVDSPDEVKEKRFRDHIHVVMKMQDGGFLIYSDIRRFGELRLLNKEDDYTPLLKMAPEPFEQAAIEHFIEMAKLPKYARKPIKEVIMDGQIISGCGNIYATEALFRMNIHPARAAERISEERKRALFQEIVMVLQESIDAGGSSISDYRNINGEAGTMQTRLQMYGKKHCKTCGRDTKSMKIAGRTSVYCPKCQR